MAVPEPQGVARLPTEAAMGLLGVPVLAMAALRARRARAATKPVHWGRRVEEEVWGRVWLAWAWAWAWVWARLYRSTLLCIPYKISCKTIQIRHYCQQ